MKRFLKHSSIVIGVVGVVYALGCSYYKKTYPYGCTHRCSKGLAFDLRSYADANGGNYPNFVDGDRLLVADYVKDSDYNLEMLIGKTVDFDEAKAFYKKHGYLLSKHSAWQFVNGVTLDHVGRAFAWDKIPLGHSGQVLEYKTREVIEVGCVVTNVPDEHWEKYLLRQQETDWEKPE